MKPAGILLRWLEVAAGAPVCIDPTWPAYARAGLRKPTTVAAAEELLELGQVERVDDHGPGLWVRYVEPSERPKGRDKISMAQIDSVLRACGPVAYNLAAVRARAGVSANCARIALDRLVIRGDVEMTAGRLGALYRRRNAATSC